MLKSIIAKLWHSLCYSLAGFKVAFIEEQSFRLEVIAAFLLFPLAAFLAHSGNQFALLIGAYFLILMAELFNSAIEVLADKIEPNHCLQIKKAKDIGSAAVFVTMLIFLLVWLPPLAHHFITN